jgi:hypothetical protein
MRFTHVPQAARFLKISDALESNQKRQRVNRIPTRARLFRSSCPGTHVFLFSRGKDVDGRVKSGHDGGERGKGEDRSATASSANAGWLG